MTYIRILIAVSGLALLTACGGGGVTITATDIAKLEAELRKSRDAQRDAETSRDDAESARANAKAAQAEAERLRGLAETAMNNAITAQLNANREVARLKNELATAIKERDSARGDKTAANLRITELEGELSTATSALSTADAEVLRLTQELATLTRALSTADAEVIRLTGDLKTVTGDKDTAESQRNDARDERDDALLAKGNADREITRLKKELSTAIGERNTANGTITTLRGQLSTAIGDKNTANGTITTLRGQLLKATTDKNAANDKIDELKEDIRLIEEARITFADWGGTDEAPNTTVIDSAGTGTDPLLNGVASVGNGNPATNFIQGLPTNAQGFDFTGTAFVDADVTGDVLLLVDNSPNGVAFSRVSGTGVTGEKFYTGLLPTTNLGAPITDISTNAIWEAKIMLITSPNLYSNLDFKMRVIFDGNEGRINSGTVSEGVFTNGVVSLASDSSNKDINIQGKFGGDGLLYGTVAYDSSTANGTLTGLIGVGGAVASFVGDSFAGGFVAYPTDPRIGELEEEARLAGIAKNTAKTTADNEIKRLNGKLSTANTDKEAADNKIKTLKNDIRLIEDARITFADWGGTAEELKPDVIDSAGTGTEPLLNGVASVGNGNPALSFIQGLPTNAQGFDFTGTAFADADVTGDVLLLVDNSPNGVAFSRVSGTGVTGEKFYTGLLPTTNLGAPITDISTDAIWEAKIMLIGSSNLYSNLDFKMQVTFDGNGGTINSGTVSGGVFTDGDVSLASDSSNKDINIWGKFGSDGLLYGTVAYDSSTANGTLTGLIGVGGAVASFVGDSFAGGFVVYPTDPRIGELEEEARLAGIAKDAADNEIKRLKNELSTAINERDSATGDKNTANDKIDELKDELRLIEEARITFADWGGTDEALKPDVIDSAGTGTEPLLNGVASVGNGNPALSFIQGLATVDDKGFDFTGTDFAEADVTGDVLLLVDNSPNGVAFSRVSGTGVTGEKFYTGLLPTTNLGAPITDISTNAIWEAKIMLITSPNLYSNLDFKMRVIFDGNEGTINSGTVSGGVFTNGVVSLASDSSNKDINIQGKFGGDGLLYGTVAYDSSTANGTLTGLIGVGGAVASFVGDSFAGGFVVYPTDPRIGELEEEARLAGIAKGIVDADVLRLTGELSTANTNKEAADNKIKTLKNDIRLIEDARITFADWGGTDEALKPDVIDSAGTGTEPLLNGVASVGNGNPATNFIQGLATNAQGFDFTGTAFSDADVTGDVLLLVDNSPNGVAFSRVSGTGVTGEKFYTGLLPTTNLGAPITDISTNAIWDAKIMLIGSPNLYSNLDFKMQVIFDGNGGRINSGTVLGGVFTEGQISVSYTIPDSMTTDSNDFNIQGRFGSDGLLYGTVAYDSSTANGTLTGLIGVGGAVASFVGDSFAGGFVVYPTDPRIAELEEEARLAGIAKDAADANILRLTGELRDANTEVERLTGELSDANTEVERLTRELSDANANVERLTGELKTVTDAKKVADAAVLRLTGELKTVTDAKEAADAEVKRLTGDLEAANTEITRLDRFIRPTYANWKLAVNPETVPNVISPQNQFLQADADSISTGETTAVPNDVQTLNLLTATFDGLPLDEEAADGVAFFQGQINGASYNYAGVFSGTDLGAPITDRAGTTAIWYGSFNHTLNPSKDFALTVTFNKIGGTLDAFVLAGIANDRFIFDDVRFDTRGLITGEVLYTTFAPNDPTATPSTKTATLRGLIGEQGAVGVFVGEVGSNMAGGFVAHPTAKLDPNKITFADWGGVDGAPKTDVPNADGTGTTPLLNGVASVGDGNPAGNFIHGLATVDGKGFNFVGTPFASATVIGDVLYMGTDRISGAAFSRVSTGARYYAGLLPTTDLGVPITAKDLSVTWDAQFTLNSNGGAFVNPSFKMRVRFNGNGGTINSGTAAGNGFTNGGVDLRKIETLHLSRGTITIAGKFGRDGVLYGTVGTGTLTGLIGVNGAVGAFVGATLAGGFVAYPNVANTINAADWGGTAGNPKTTVINKDNTGTDPLLNGFKSIVYIGPDGNFIQGLPTVVGKGFNFAGTSFSGGDVHGDVLLLDEGSSSGVAFSEVSGTGVRNRKYYAGLLPGTNLGSPITDITTDAIWNAQFGAVYGGFCCDTLEYSHLGFKMRVIFNGIGHSTIDSGTVSNRVFTKGSVTVPYTNLTSPGFDGSSDFSIQGKFGDDGLLYGTVNLGENIEATLTGLVGVNGAVGAFVSTERGSVNIAGGFVAYPIADVNFADWAGFAGNRRTTVINKDNTGTLPLLNGATSVSNANDTGNFIERLATSDGKGFDFAGTAFRKASVFGDVLYLDEHKTSGSGVAFSHVGATEHTDRRYYAGLLPGTNLGSRITDPNTSAIWDARLMGVFRIISPRRYSSSNFKMQVIFDGNEGTINSGTVSGSSFTPGQIATNGFGQFNIQGKFGRDGLLYGKVGTNLEGTLTGLIGVDGAVGAFTFTSNVLSYVGGFVAAPPE